MCTRGVRVYSLPDARDFALVFGACAHTEAGLLSRTLCQRNRARARVWEVQPTALNGLLPFILPHDHECSCVVLNAM